MKYFGLPRAICDETYSSWLWRCSEHNMSSLELRRLLRNYYDKKLRKGDPDFELAGELVRGVTQRLKLPSESFKFFFESRTHHVLDPTSRFAHCPYCIRDDISDMRLPAWRKKWCYIAAPICPVHKCLLAVKSSGCPFEKGWEAFSECAAYLKRVGKFSICSYPRFVYVRQVFGVPDYMLPIDAGLTMQRWFLSLDRLERCWHRDKATFIDSTSLKHVCYLFLQILLSCRSENRDPGFARFAFNQGYEPINRQCMTYQECMSVGAASAVPYHRLVAMLIVGVVFKVLTPFQINQLKKLTAFLNYRISTLEALGYETPPFYSFAERDWLIGQLRSVPPILRSYIEPFVDGVEKMAKACRLER